MAASEGLLALGATTGGLYCFDLGSRKLLTILQHKEGQVVEVRDLLAQVASLLASWAMPSIMCPDGARSRALNALKTER